MPKTLLLLLLIAACAMPTVAQSPSEKLPTVTTGGDLNPEVVSDTNAQLVWLLAASPTALDTDLEKVARSEYQRAAFGALSAPNQAALNATLREFRIRHDAYATEYNALIPSISRDDVWMEYRNFRVKVNDLVAETIRNLYSTFPDSAGPFHTAIEECKRTMYLSSYRSTADPDYATSPRAAATGFTYIQGAVAGRSRAPEKQNASYGGVITAVIVGMVPGCPGKVVPSVFLGGSDAGADGPHIHPWEYMNFQMTGRVRNAQSGYVIAVNCAISKPQ